MRCFLVFVCGLNAGDCGFRLMSCVVVLCVVLAVVDAVL